MSFMEPFLLFLAVLPDQNLEQKVYAESECYLFSHTG